MNTRVTRKRGKLGFLLLQIVLAYAFSLTCMPVSAAGIRNDTLKSAVITDTKFYFPSFFEQNQQQERWSRGGSFSPYAIYSGRALSVQRWNSIFCRAARISMSHVRRFRSFRRAWEEGQGSPEKSRASVFQRFNTSRFYEFLTLQILTLYST